MKGRESMFNGRCDGLRTRRHLELREDAFNMESDSPFAHTKNLADLPIGLPIFHPIEDRDFSRGKLLDASIGRRSRLRGSSEKRHVYVIPQVFDERNQPLAIK